MKEKRVEMLIMTYERKKRNRREVIPGTGTYDWKMERPKEMVMTLGGVSILCLEGIAGGSEGNRGEPSVPLFIAPCSVTS